MIVNYLQAVGAGRASSSLLGPFGSHTTSDLLGREISIRFAGQDDNYNTFYETTNGTDSSNLRLRSQNQYEFQSLARQVACSFFLPTPSTSLELEADNTEVDVRNGRYFVRRLVGRSNDHQQITDSRVTINVDRVEIGTRRRPAGTQVVEIIHLSERFARIEVLLAHVDNVELNLPEGFNLGEAIAEVRNPDNLHQRTSTRNLNRLMTVVSAASNGQYDGESDLLPFLESLLPNGPDYEMLASVVADGIDAEVIGIAPSELDDSSSVETEVVRLVRSRLRQGRLRRLRLGTPAQSPTVECVMCQRAVPNSGTWVWCSHIVRWSDDEAARLDRANVAPMCRMGCDSAFESGLITVNAQGIIELNQEHPEYVLLAEAFEGIAGSNVNDHDYAPSGTPSSQYYARHRASHLP